MAETITLPKPREKQDRKLRRQPGNDGRVRVLVPPGAIGEAMEYRPPRHWNIPHLDAKPALPNVPHNAPSPVAAFEAALAVIREAHAGEVAALREQLDALRQAEAERQGRGRLRRLREAWRGT